MVGADPGTLAALRAGNAAYQARFGFMFLIRAAGRSAAETLAALEERLGNDPVTEFRIATEQLREITRLRLCELIEEADGLAGHPAAGADTGEAT